MRTSLIALFVTMVVASPGSAKDVFIRGIGAHRCATFLQDTALHPTSANLVYVTWAEGFVSGMNVATAAAGGGYHDLSAVAGGIKGDLRRFCRAHRRAQFTDAVMAIYLKQQHRRYTSN